jgi:hypothetical protein
MHRRTTTAALAALVFAGSLQAGETIPYPPGLTLGGAAGYLGTVDHSDSPYFQHPDVFNLPNTHSRILLPRFKTYQQTTEYTCGPAAVVMAAEYRGTRLNELEVATATGANTDTGTSTEQLVRYLEATGWVVRSSLREPNKASLKFLQQQLQHGNPVLVEWVDWAGHWQVVIGYDDLGTPNAEEDDVLIVADPYDTTDHRQDGYGLVPAQRFNYMWFDHNLLPEGQRERQWIIFDRSRR